MSKKYENRKKSGFKWAISIIIFGGLLAIAITLASGGGTEGEVGTNKGNIAPDFSIQTIDGRSLSLADLRGKKALVITSTASWCPTCIVEAREFALVYPQFQDSVEFLSVSIDPTDNTAKLEKFSIDNNTPWLYTEPNLPGTTDFIIDYRFNRFEITYIIDKDGVIQDHKRGPMNLDEMKQRVRNKL